MNHFDNDYFLTSNPDSEPELLNWQEIFEFARDQALYLGKNYQDAEDIAQTIAKRLFTKNLEVRNWRAYVSTMTKNLIIDIYRGTHEKARFQDGLPEPGDIRWRGVRDVVGNPASVFKPQELAIAISESDLLMQVLAEVPEDHRELFIDYLEGVPAAKLAKIYGYASAASVNQTVSRIKKRLREQFAAIDLQ